MNLLLIALGIIAGVGMTFSFMGKTSTKNSNTISNSFSDTKINGGFVGGHTTQDIVEHVKGNNIIINGGRLIVDGVEIRGGLNNYHIEVIVEGGCETVTTGNGNVTVNGDVSKNISTSNGRVEIKGGIGGNVQTSNGRVSCGGSINGSVKTTNGRISSGS